DCAPIGNISAELVFAFVDQFVFGNPGHHGAQLLTNLLNFRFGDDTATRGQGGCTCSVFQDEVFGVFTTLDLGEAFAHGLAGLGCDDFRSCLVLGKFSDVCDGVIHVGDAAFVDEVNDQLELVQAFEICHFWCVTCVDQGVKACADQLYSTPTQYGLFTKEIGFGFFAEGGLDDTCAAAAVGAGIGHGDVTSCTRVILINSD